MWFIDRNVCALRLIKTKDIFHFSNILSISSSRVSWTMPLSRTNGQPAALRTSHNTFLRDRSYKDFLTRNWRDSLVSWLGLATRSSVCHKQRTHSYIMLTPGAKAQSYKTLYGRNLRIFVISYSVCFMASLSSLV